MLETFFSQKINEFQNFEFVLFFEVVLRKQPWHLSQLLPNLSLISQFININGLFVQSWKFSNIQTWSSFAIRCDRNQEFLWQNQGSTGTTEKEGTGIFYTCLNKKLFKSCGSFVILFRWRQLEGWIDYYTSDVSTILGVSAPGSYRSALGKCSNNLQANTHWRACIPS